MSVPYIVSWSGERPLPRVVVELAWSGIGYLDETLGDRDDHGVLWQRVLSRPGSGRPEFGKVHPLRQRRVMRRLLCGVCAAPADRTDERMLWLLRDYRGDWPGWPEGMAAVEPPVCLPCAHRSVRACPALRRGHVAVRVGECQIAGVYGVRYQAGQPLPSAADDVTVSFADPAIRWTCAAQLVRELRECSIVDWEP